MAVDAVSIMAKTRKRSETATIDVDAPTNRRESPESPPGTSRNGDAERIAVRAYELYLARGGTHGSDWEDWLTAERELAGTRSDSEDR
jgi:hypothetical protein